MAPDPRSATKAVARRLATTRFGRRLALTGAAHRLGMAPSYQPTALELLGDVIPDDRAEQVHAGHYIDRMAADLDPGSTVLDLGCGAGKTRHHFRNANPDLRWVGIDVRDSPEAEERHHSLTGIAWFDGVELPFGDQSISCVYSRHVMEHVRHPEHLLREVRRVLKPDGRFVGMTSNLEPYHSFSYWNFTPYGFKTLVEAAGLELLELRPGIDGPTLIERQLHRRYTELGRYFGLTSPVNAEIIEWGKRGGHSPAVVNDRMLQFCGHFGFVAGLP